MGSTKNKLSDLDILQKFQNHFSSNDNNNFHYHNNYNNNYYYDYHHDYNNDHDDNNYNARYRITEMLFKYLDYIQAFIYIDDTQNVFSRAVLLD